MDNQKLQQVLGYARWENFVVAIGRAMESCKTLGISIDDHFREVTKMVQLRPRVGCIFARIPGFAMIVNPSDAYQEANYFSYNGKILNEIWKKPLNM